MSQFLTCVRLSGCAQENTMITGKKICWRDENMDQRRGQEDSRKEFHFFAGAERHTAHEGTEKDTGS